MEEEIEAEWLDDYNVGVEYLDNAHREMFRVIYKFREIINDKDEMHRQAVCASMLRYLVKYTNQHFKQEEDYMLAHKYEGYEIHKHLHDNMRAHTLPYLIHELEEKKYADESIDKFTSMICGWLVGHILVEDRAITGKIISRWNHTKYKGDAIAQIDEEFRLFTEDLFTIKVHLVNRYYEGEYIGDNIYKFYNTFTGPMHSYRTLFLCDEKFLSYGVDRMTHHETEEVTELALESFEEIVQSWAKAALNIVDDIEDFEITETQISKDLNYNGFFDNPHPLQSLIWKADSKLIGIAIKEIQH